MSYVPEKDLQEGGGLTLAPMIDFLFLLLAMFASLAVTRVALKDTDIELVKSKTTLPSSNIAAQEYKIITIGISEEGKYKWVTEVRDHTMESAGEIAQELLKQYQRGLLPEDKLKTQILLRIDKNAHWEPILQVLLAVRDAGFEVRPVYEPDS